MPASSPLVSLDHAKNWAKRLVKHGSFPSLAKAQAAVAVMLGHADWHGLTRHYAPAPIPTGPGNNAPRTMEDGLVALCDEVNRLYPGLGATQVVEMARELDVLDAMIHEVADQAQQHEWDGENVRTAVRLALEPHVHVAKAPPGHILLRVALNADDRFALVLVTSEVYGKALQLTDSPKG